YRLDHERKVIVGRNQEDNGRLQFLQQAEHETDSVLLEPDGFVGPAALLVGPPDERSLKQTGALLLRHAKVPRDAAPRVQRTFRNRVDLAVIEPDHEMDALSPITAGPGAAGAHSEKMTE